MTFESLNQLQKFLEESYRKQTYVDYNQEIDRVTIEFPVYSYFELQKMLDREMQTLGFFVSVPIGVQSEIKMAIPGLPNVIFVVKPRSTPPHPFNKEKVYVSSTGHLKETLYLKKGILQEGEYSLQTIGAKNTSPFKALITRKGDEVSVLVVNFPVEVLINQEVFFKKYKLIAKQR